jgi:hypothetical protein
MSKNTNLSFLTDYITADITNGRIGINNASPTVAFDVTGVAKFSSSVGIGNPSTIEGVLTIKGTSAQPPTSGTTANSLLQLVGSLGAELNIGSNTVAGGYGSYIQASDNNLAVPYPLNLQPNGGSVGIGKTPRTGFGINLDVSGGIQLTNDSANISYLAFGQNSNPQLSYTYIGGDARSTGFINFFTNDTERMRILANGNVGIGTSSPGYKLQVSGNGYFGSGLTVEGTAAATSLSATAAIVTYNVATFVVTNSYSFTPPNMLTASSTDSEMKMYMVWIWGANTAIYGGVRVWMIAVNGGGTAYTVNTLLSRDVGAGTGLDLTRTSATQLTITSNNAAAIKWVSIMQLNTNT